MKLAYEQYGDGPPLVTLHGLLGSSDNWRSFGKRLGETYTVYAVDLRNHGASPHRDRMDYEVMAEDLLHFFRGHTSSPVHLLGHSLGGKVAMECALSYPEEIDRLVVVDIAPRAYSPAHRELIEALWELDLGAVSSRRDADEMLSEEIPEWGIRQFLLKNLVRVEEGRYEWECNLEAIRHEYDKLTRAIEPGRRFRGESLFVRGDRSDYVRDEDRTEIEEYFPRAEITTIRGAGHWVHADEFDLFAQTVEAFLAH